MSGFAIGAAVVAVIGASISAYSAYEQGQSQKALARYNAAQQDAQNQALLQQSAAKSLAEREQNQKILASQEAAYAASGVVTNSGSPLTVETKQAAYLERKALNTDYEGALANRYGQSQTRTDDFEATAASKAGTLNASATLLSGAGNAASSYYSMGGPGSRVGK